MQQYIRWQSEIIFKALKTRRVVLLEGARQCGKTTLTKSLLNPDVVYYTLDDKLLLQAAKYDPQSFVKNTNRLMIIDEVQKATELLPAIKMIVDNDQRPGQYLLTGSANIQSLPSVTESLAGRVRSVPLRPLARGEIFNHQPTFLENAFKQCFQKPINHFDRDDIIEFAMGGGYAEPLRLPIDERQLWHHNYIDTLLARDLKDIINIKRYTAMEQLIQVVCAWSTKLIDIAAIGSQLSLQRQTIDSYLNALNALYLVDRIPAFAKTDYERVGKSPKLIFNDSGLMASILRWRLDDIRFDADRVGKLIETHVGNELQKHVDTTENKCTMYHYRDREKREIDFLIEGYHGELLGIEVKASNSPSLQDFKHLKVFNDSIKLSKQDFVGIILYTGNNIVAFGENLWAVPIACLY